jgi:hypothetical protein
VNSRNNVSNLRELKRLEIYRNSIILRELQVGWGKENNEGVAWLLFRLNVTGSRSVRRSSETSKSKHFPNLRHTCDFGKLGDKGLEILEVENRFCDEA